MLTSVEARYLKGCFLFLLVMNLPAMTSLRAGHQLMDSIIDDATLRLLIAEADDNDTIDLYGQTIDVFGKGIGVNKPLVFTGGTIRRACTPVTTLKAASSDNAQEIIVNSTEGFAPGHWLLLVNGSGFGDNSGGQIMSVQEIEGDTIRTFQPFANAMDSGAVLIHQFPLIRIGSPQEDSIHFHDVIFDGNQHYNSYTFDWKYNPTIVVGAATLLTNCTFMNTPSENIFMCGGIVRNCKSYNLNGSFVHGSCPGSNSATSLVVDNVSYNSCRQPVSVNGHNEGWFSYSANVTGFSVIGNTAVNGGNACFGAQGMDDFGNTFSQNLFKNYPIRKFGTATNHPATDSLVNNTFINVQF